MVTVIVVTHGSCCVLLVDGWMSDGRERWESCGVASVSHHVAPCRGHVAGMSGREHVAGMSRHVAAFISPGSHIYTPFGAP
eukprot:834240-Prymnesium_polylepis.1